MAQSNRTALKWLSLVVLVCLWGLVIRQLGGVWSVYPQYNYGWSVPVLMAVLLWRRWENRPDRVPPRDMAAAVLIAVALALLFFPTRLVQEANPIWRLGSWLLAVEAVGLTLGAVYCAGGVIWLRHFSFPIAFFFVAVPWPSLPEAAFIQALSRLNAHATVEALSLFGIPALTHGNVIEISTGLVGIDDACSGVRSFQATLMISLLLGEIYRMDVGRRAGLILTGAGLAFAANFCRTSLLVWVCARQGVDALKRWHDPAGVAILLVCFVGLWLDAMWLDRGRKRAVRVLTRSQLLDWPQLLPGLSAVWLAAWLVGVEVTTQAWYRAHEKALQTPQEWTVQWPTQKPTFHETPIGGTVRRQLNYDEAKSAAWQEDDGSRWQLFYFRWLPGRTLFDRVRVQFARSHRPESCLPATGMVLQDDLGVRMIEINGISLPFHSYVFDDQGIPLHVYFCVWEEGTQGAAAGNMREDTRTRLEAAWSGNRSVGQRVVEIAVWGTTGNQEADSALVKELQAIIAR